MHQKADYCMQYHVMSALAMSTLGQNQGEIHNLMRVIVGALTCVYPCHQ